MSPFIFPPWGYLVCSFCLHVAVCFLFQMWNYNVGMLAMNYWNATDLIKDDHQGDCLFYLKQFHFMISFNILQFTASSIFIISWMYAPRSSLKLSTTCYGLGVSLFPRKKNYPSLNFKANCNTPISPWIEMLILVVSILCLLL